MYTMLRCQLVLILSILLWVSNVQPESKPGTLRIGAFNIQVFGQKKSKNPQVMQILVKIIRRYDILLIQEIRDSRQTAIVQLLSQVNEGQPVEKQFTMSISNRLGRTVSKEQYAYLYRPGSGLVITEEIEFDDANDALEPSDKYEDFFEREPFLVKVSSLYTVPKEFVLIGIHVAPKEAVHEINELDDVFDYAINKMKVNDVVVMGDLNADCTYVSQSDWDDIPLRSDSRYKWFIEDTDHTTVKKTHCAYDRFIFTKSSWTTGIKPNSVTVYEYDDDPNIMKEMPPELAIKVSDHYPIEFQLLSAKISINEVYVDLDPCKSLLEDELYTLSGTTVLDENGMVVGYLRPSQKDLIDALQEIVDENLNSKPVEVVRQRRKYRCRQKTVISIYTDVDSRQKVKGILTSKGVKFE